jgi:hypothetical protein
LPPSMPRPAEVCRIRILTNKPLRTKIKNLRKGGDSMKRSIIAVAVLGLLPGCAAVQVPHRSPLPGRDAGPSIDLAEIMADTSGIFDSSVDPNELRQQPAESNLLRFNLSLAVVNPKEAVDDIADIAAANGGYISSLDTSRLDLCVPTGALKAVLAAIGTLGDIAGLTYAGRSPLGAFPDEGQPQKAITLSNICFQLLQGPRRFLMFGWVPDESSCEIGLMRERSGLMPGQLEFTSIAVTLIVVQPRRPGIADYVLYMVKGIAHLVKR